MSRGLIFVWLAVAWWWGWVVAMAMGRVPACRDMGNEVLSCFPYVIDVAFSPAPSCCKGVVDIVKLGVTRGDRRIICECVKKAFSLVPRIDLGRAQGLPHTCGTNTDIPIGPGVDCSK